MIFVIWFSSDAHNLVASFFWPQVPSKFITTVSHKTCKQQDHCRESFVKEFHVVPFWATLDHKLFSRKLRPVWVWKRSLQSVSHICRINCTRERWGVKTATPLRKIGSRTTTIRHMTGNGPATILQALASLVRLNGVKLPGAFCPLADPFIQVRSCVFLLSGCSRQNVHCRGVCTENAAHLRMSLRLVVTNNWSWFWAKCNPSQQIQRKM